MIRERHNKVGFYQSENSFDRLSSLKQLALYSAVFPVTKSKFPTEAMDWVHWNIDSEKFSVQT